MRPSIRQLAVIAACVTALLPAALALPARAQWVENGLHLTTLSRQIYGFPIADGVGGAFVILADRSNYDLMRTDFRLLRLDVFGYPAPGWTADGFLIDQTSRQDYAQSGSLQHDGTLTTAYAHDQKLFAGRFRPDGSVVPGWEPGATPVSTDPRWQEYADSCPAADDGTWFAWWSDYTQQDVGVQRLGPDGQYAPGWPSDGKIVAGGPGWQYLWSGPIPDGVDGIWLAYFSVPPTTPATDSEVFVQHLDGLGDPSPGFTFGGVNACTVPGTQLAPAICADGAGGVYVAWSDARSCPGAPDYQLRPCYDIYLQRITATGERAAGWPADGLGICVWPGEQANAKLVPDGTGGVYVAWEYGGPQGATFHAQRILADGSVAPGWPVGGKRMFTADATIPEMMAVCSDQLGGLFLAGSQYKLANGGDRLWVQHVNRDGEFDAPWGADGLPAVSPSIVSTDEGFAELAESLPGSVIMTWSGARGEAYAQRITLDGLVATTVSLASVEPFADRIELVWHAGGDPLASARIERREADQDWRVLAMVAPDGTGQVRYADHAVTPGARYAYRLTWAEGSALRHTSEAWVAVPLGARFALAGASPNPSPRASLSVAYSLAERGPARLELYDAQGRAVARHDLAASEPGAHVERFAEAASLRTGLYWLRLVQGASSATARVVLVD